jgi:pSer/pThr/pTyr-binding forkhead associated (FHA) protein
MPTLRLILEGVEVKTAMLEDAAVTIGRASDNEMVINDPAVSGKHCAVEPDPEGGYRLRDLESTNGTHVNGQLAKEWALQPGDVITIGAARIVFEDKETESAPLADTMNLGDTVRLAGGLPTPGFKPKEDRRFFWWIVMGLVGLVTLAAAVKYAFTLAGH